MLVDQLSDSAAVLAYGVVGCAHTMEIAVVVGPRENVADPADLVSIPRYLVCGHRSPSPIPSLCCSLVCNHLPLWPHLVNSSFGGLGCKARPVVAHHQSRGKRQF